MLEGADQASMPSTSGEPPVHTVLGAGCAGSRSSQEPFDRWFGGDSFSLCDGVSNRLILLASNKKR
jgi:hypothetical protein